ncbi:MAG: hypothetical protein GTN62_05620 [Gemmatimonadales bacterium]|nr:hypothetical protein [Gemmatimonadales bacterium]NIN10983.1 hypothetical protein [Gemmatimonadales bacterium]NIN49575.1 hypothetical protein [Gemmatimonadales bacterium]NIP07039.1 hypothetical protein [Gemmatimonadales bacterium]NIR01673.1 hypothetical protein [Gemmatimonadales bacterium]
MNRKRFALLGLGLGLLSVATGACGFIFSHAPPEGHEQMEYFTCTESDAGPIIDLIWAGLNVLGAVVVAGDPDYYEDSGAIIASGLVWGAFSSAAGAVGLNKSKKCRAAKRGLAERQARGQVEGREPIAADTVVLAVVVSPAVDTLEIGERVQLVATPYNSSGGIISNKTFTWSSSNDAIASVSRAGLVMAHANGGVIIAANTENVVGTARIVVVSRL